MSKFHLPCHHACHRACDSRLGINISHASVYAMKTISISAAHVFTTHECVWSRLSVLLRHPHLRRYRFRHESYLVLHLPSISSNPLFNWFSDKTSEDNIRLQLKLNP